ncbi:hypothetical protein LYSIN_02397 [Lysinibacillus sphaericus]|uniref:Uncharacterized protein n=1 Tax=Lysinibacillus sphaericus TaxID=1421 RepID=A0A2S5D3I2_LYSSH|nr:hypothetical protein LYSIN_02397 [Lysinibacillus sphaericus]
MQKGHIFIVIIISLIITLINLRYLSNASIAMKRKLKGPVPLECSFI